MSPRLAWVIAFAAALVLATGHALVAVGAGVTFAHIADRELAGSVAGALLAAWSPAAKIGRASCRERV